jgi:hypothetical protein
MASRREGEQNPYWKRMEVVMKVFMGQMNVTEAARELGITRAYYYQLEEEMLRAALEAVTPSKPGPKTTPIDPSQVKKDEELEKIRREKELLEIKVKHLKELQSDMITRGLGVLKEKKRRRLPQVRRRHGKKIHGPVPAVGAVETGGAIAPGRNDQGTVPGTGPQPGQSVPLEGQGGRQEARPTNPAGRVGRRDGVGGSGVRSREGRNLGNPSHVRGSGRDHSSKPGEHGAR